MGTAPKLAETLQRYPILLDAVLTDDFFQPLPPPACLSQEFEKEIDLKSRDYQDTLDIVRRLVNDRLFKIGVQILKKDILRAGKKSLITLNTVQNTTVELGSYATEKRENFYEHESTNSSQCSCWRPHWTWRSTRDG